MDHPALFYLHQDLRRRLRYARHQTARHLEANPPGNSEYAWAKALERHMGDFAYDLPMFFYDQGLTEEFSALPHSAEVIVQVEQSEPPDPPRKGERYRVQSGDTLEGIARQYGITLAALYEVNPDLKAQDPRKLAVGAEVILPAGAPFGIKARIDLLVPMHEHRMIELAYHLGLIEHITGVDFLDLNYYRYGQSPYPSGWNKPFHQQSSSQEVPYQQDWHSPWSVPRDSWSAFAPSLYKSEPEHPRQRGPWNPFFLNEQQQRVGELGQQPCRFRHKDLVSPPGLSLGQSIVVTANRHIQEASPERLEELISICPRRPYQLVLEAPDVLTGINNSMTNTASFIFNLGANAWNGIAMSVNYSYAVMTGAEKNISGAEAIYRLEQYIKADYERMLDNPKDYFYEGFTNLENYEDVAAALIARKFAPKGPGKGPKSKKATVVESDKINPKIKASKESGIVVRSPISGLDIRPAKFVDEVQKGAKVENLVSRALYETRATGVEHAVIQLTDGSRHLVSGGRNGIRLPENTDLLFGHTHPPVRLGELNTPSLGDRDALDALDQSKQYIFHDGQRTTIYKGKDSSFDSSITDY